MSDLQMQDIFISYRRDGGEFLAHLLYERLKNAGYSVFLDIESLRSGEFNRALFEKIDGCTDFLLILPPKGLDRCSDPKDWVRLEIERAIEKNKNIVPVMMRNFTFPDDLPEKLSRIKFFNGVTADLEFFDSVMDKLINRFLKTASPLKHEKKAVGDFEKQQIIKCHRLIKDYLRSDNVESEEGYSEMFVEISDAEPFISEEIFKQIINFAETELRPIWENHYELFTEPMIKAGCGKINENGAFEIFDEESMKKVVAHFYEVLFAVEDKFNKFTKEVLSPILNG